jgi:NIPSNAP
VIYQHRFLLSDPGKLLQRHATFEGASLAALDSHGSVLVGAWEVWVGKEAGRAVYQLRQFESLASWAEHQDRVRSDGGLMERRRPNLGVVEFSDSAILRQADGSPSLPVSWPSVAEVRGQPRGFVEQRILLSRPDTSGAHHEFYFEKLSPALDKTGSKLVALLDTVIGPGTSNAGSHRSIELRWFASMGDWEQSREKQKSSPEFVDLREEWLSKLEHIESALLRPLDYSRIR